MRILLSFLFMLFGAAVAAPPPFGEWLKLRVTSCQPVEFHAPEDADRARRLLYQHGEKRRVALVYGEVVDARNYTADGKWTWSFQPPATGLIGTYIHGFIDETTDQSCPPNAPAEVTFVRSWSCDAGWRRGTCLVPFPQLARVSSDEKFRFVEPTKR